MPGPPSDESERLGARSEPPPDESERPGPRAEAPEPLGNLINGAFVAPAGKTLVSRNPAADGAVVFETLTSVHAVAEAAAAAAAAQLAGLEHDRVRQPVGARGDRVLEPIER
jgi:hypothetical protein